ncbi:IGSF9B [Mytilus edulis]|uniref:IGSF9B n=1 Tax=Mytilus edulis TaxID=6550 RepID=A0A8S3QNE3_MYTED|nr:IGSF9B [Mytilus edulis]
MITSANAKIRCLEGVRLTSPLDTTIVTECGDHEICSVERYVTNDGIILYNVGCKDRQYCIANPLGKLGVGKRAETVICRHCCEDKDLCNMNQCGARVNLPVGSTICYKCPLAMDANKCNHITLCDRDSVINVQQLRKVIPRESVHFVVTRNYVTVTVTIRSTIAPITPITTTCLCNGAIKVTAPIITQTVIRPTNIKYGDTVTIQCIATGNPKPTIDFLVKGRGLGSNVHVDPTTHLLTISNFLPNDDGDYRCIAANLLGDVHKDTHLQGHS